MIPSSLLICDRSYTVTSQPMLGSLGCCANDTQTITIDSDSHPQTQESVLLHEVLEAINASMDLRLKHRTISALETALYSILVTNPSWWEETD